ncbi:hypothetical protein BASA50_009534 [Batrachochytrium salamandrivorans]|uniref:GPP34-domain-containing protein n=1 Tax=Batrachochytrium salamandrivorans TaxID=1357716 RepID=A0ABQ8F1P9_9FUNG|nr:hypothetical protein BASA50_009534 [Batrachochytrium salamandrivorans]
MASEGLTQRRRGGGAAAGNEANDHDNGEYPGADDSDRIGGSQAKEGGSGSGAQNSAGGIAGSGKSFYDQEGYDEDDDASSTAPRGRKLTLMEEVLLLGYKDNEGRLSFWNDNISYVLRGAILIELSFRNRVATIKEPRKRPYPERLIEVNDERLTGEVLLDEAMRYIKTDVDSIGNWIDLLSGETWNLTKIGYQLKQVRERIAKGLVDKGVLRTDKLSFVLFDLPTHPLADPKSKRRSFSGRWIVFLGEARQWKEEQSPCHSQREAAFQKVDDLLQEHASFSDKARTVGTTEVMAGVFSVYAKMDSIL